MSNNSPAIPGFLILCNRAFLQTESNAFSTYTKQGIPAPLLSLVFPQFDPSNYWYPFADLIRMTRFDARHCSVVENIMKIHRLDRDSNPDRYGESQTC